MLDVLMLSVCDCNQVGSISDVSKNLFLNERTSLKKEDFINANSLIIRFLKLLKSSFKLSFSVVFMLFIWSSSGTDKEVLFA